MNNFLAGFSRISVLLLVFLAASGIVLRGTLCVMGADEASAKIGEADNAVRQAFKAVLEAEDAGANVSGLLDRLDEAGRFLADAEMAYRGGNASEAFAEAGSSFSMAEDVKGEAAGLKASAQASAANVFRWDLAFSSVGSAAFLVVLFFVWRRFKRGHVRRMLGMKPEVAHDEA